MEEKYTRKFLGEENKVNVMGVAKVETNESAYNIYVFYTIPKEENRYKVLNCMIDSDTIEPYVYYFESPKSASGKPITGTPHHFAYNTNDWFVFGGATTFLEGDAKKRVFLDWTGQKKTFGFVQAWTPTEHCKTERALLNEKNGKFGTKNVTTYPVAKFTLVTIRSGQYQEIAPREPLKLQMEDMDDSGWDDLLSDNKDKEFDVQYQNWQDSSDGGKD